VVHHDSNSYPSVSRISYLVGYAGNMQDKSERRASAVWRKKRSCQSARFEAERERTALLGVYGAGAEGESGKVIIATIAYGITTETSGTHYSCFIYTSLSISA